ncbi:MAG: shikimate dehydrogenase [Cyclobacteriaceae bacterium]|nr:shikimate dehydrogenase [Cyclobacteriaceae bacterium]
MITENDPSVFRQFGLIGYPLSHSFSKKFFSEKFIREEITNCRYDVFEIDSIQKVNGVFTIPGLVGFNVTIPYKTEIMAFLQQFDDSARKVGAVNVVKIEKDGSRTGYNSDYYGFRTSLEKWVPLKHVSGALILGIGGAAKAVLAVLDDLGISYLKVSRDSNKGDLTYDDLKKESEIFDEYPLIINTTPLGMSPNIDSFPDLNYHALGSNHYLYDLIYNPPETAFLKAGSKNGAQTKNGHEMLILQAEKSWEIWNS